MRNLYEEAHLLIYKGWITQHITRSGFQFLSGQANAAPFFVLAQYHHLHNQCIVNPLLVHMIKESGDKVKEM